METTASGRPGVPIRPNTEKTLFQRIVEAADREEVRKLLLQQRAELVELRRIQMQEVRRLNRQLRFLAFGHGLAIFALCALLLGAPQW